MVAESLAVVEAGDGRWQAFSKTPKQAEMPARIRSLLEKKFHPSADRAKGSAFRASNSGADGGIVQ
jgi:hypothetical protein